MDDWKDLWTSVKSGDVDRVAYLLDVEGADVNSVDAHDATPLYYAALVGHAELVRLLLSHGARFDEATFQGERAYYVALNDEVRQLLKSHKVTAAVATPFRRWCGTLIDSLEEVEGDKEEALRPEDVHGLDGRSGMVRPDVVFVVGTSETPGGIRRVRAHKVVLACRCPFFALAFAPGGRWHAVSRDVEECEDATVAAMTVQEVTLRNARIVPRAFSAVVRWIYTARLAAERALLPALVCTCRALRLEGLLSDLLAEQASWELEQQRGGGQLCSGQVVVASPKQNAEHERCFAALARTMAVPLPTTAKFSSTCYPYADTLLQCCAFDASGATTEPTPPVCFAAHRVFLSQSDYFCTFTQPRWGFSASHFRLDGVSRECASAILEFLSSGNVAGLGSPLVFELLGEADRLLLPHLKALCGNVLMQHTDASNVFTVLELAKTYDLLKLEEHCSVVFGACLETVVEDPSFAALVEESARSIVAREAEDSIPLVDEISDAIRKLHGWDRGESETEDDGAEGEGEGGLRSGMRRLHVTAEGKHKLRLLFDLVHKLGFQVLPPIGLESTGPYDGMVCQTHDAL